MKRMALTGWGLLLVGLAFVPAMAEAQGTFESLAEYVTVSGDPVDLIDGAIVTLDENRYSLSDNAYDLRVHGVINVQPAVSFSLTRGEDDASNVPIVTTGNVTVNVSTRNGVIEVGDFVTTSDRPGVGMRANDPGMVLGVALERYEATSEDDVGQIAVSISKHFAVSPTGEDLGVRQTIGAQVRNALVTGAVAAVSDPNTALRYTISGVTMLMALAFALFVFGRTATHGVQAVGRNPAARRSILLAVSFNVLMAVAMIAGAAVVVFFMLAL